MTGDYKPTLQELRDAVAMVSNPLWASEFFRKVQKTKNGDIIKVCVRSYESWWPHQEGAVVLRRDNDADCIEMRLNNEDILQRFGGIWGHVCLHPRGLVQFKPGRFSGKNQYFLNDGKELTEIISTDSTYLKNMQSNPQGLLFEKDGKIMLNDEEIYTLLPEDRAWRAHPYGFAVRRGQKIFLNGWDLIYEGNIDPKAAKRKQGVKRWEGCCLQGVIFRQYGLQPEWSLNDQALPLPKKNWDFDIEKNAASLNKDGIYFCGQDNNIYFLVWRQR